MLHRLGRLRGAVRGRHLRAQTARDPAEVGGAAARAPQLRRVRRLRAVDAAPQDARLQLAARAVALGVPGDPGPLDGVRLDGRALLHATGRARALFELALLAWAAWVAGTSRASRRSPSPRGSSRTCRRRSACTGAFRTEKQRAGRRVLRPAGLRPAVAPRGHGERRPYRVHALPRARRLLEGRARRRPRPRRPRPRRPGLPRRGLHRERQGHGGARVVHSERDDGRRARRGAGRPRRAQPELGRRLARQRSRRSSTTTTGLLPSSSRRTRRFVFRYKPRYFDASMAIFFATLGIIAYVPIRRARRAAGHATRAGVATRGRGPGWSA